MWHTLYFECSSDWENNYCNCDIELRVMTLTNPSKRKKKGPFPVTCSSGLSEKKCIFASGIVFFLNKQNHIPKCSISERLIPVLAALCLYIK